MPVVLHLFARETTATVPFGAVHLIEPAPVEQTRRRRVTDLVLLLLRMAILVLLALAFARPYVDRAAAGEPLPLTVVAIDASASMSAPQTWALARQRAQDAVDAAPAGNLVALAVFGGDARVAVEPTTDRRAVRSAIDTLAPGAGPTRVGSLFDLVGGLSAGRQFELVVVSDLPASIAAEKAQLRLAEGATLRLEPVTPPASDLRVVSVRRTAAGVAALIESEGAERQASLVSLRLDGRALNEQAVSFDGGTLAQVAFSADLPARGVVSVRVQDPGGRPAGDERFLVLDRRPPLRVLVIEPSGAEPEASLFVREALAAEPDGAFAPDVRRADETALGGGEWAASTDAVVLLGTRGMDRRARDRMATFVRQGGGMLLAAGALTEAPVVRELVARDVGLEVVPGSEPQEARLLVGASRHPLAAAFADLAAGLGDVRLSRTTSLAAREDDVVLRLSSGGAALVERRVGAGRVLVFASDLSGRWNDFPTHAAFVPFVAEAVRFAAGVGSVPASLEVSDVPGADRPGVAEVGSPARRVAVNVPREEFGQAALDPAEVEGMVTRHALEPPAALEAGDQEGLTPPWRLVILAALALLVAEGLLAARARRSIGVPS